MFIESLFNIPQVVVQKTPDPLYFHILIPNNIYPRLVSKLSSIFYNNYTNVSLLSRDTHNGCVRLVVVWRHIIPEGGERFVTELEAVKSPYTKEEEQ